MKLDTILVAIIMVGIVLMLVSSIGGSVRFLTVLGGSMEPNIRLGDMIITQSVPASQIQVNDVITYAAGKDALVTHRVTDITDSGFFITKGDANEDADPTPINPNNVLGKVVYDIPLLGYLLHFSTTVYGFLLFIVLPGLLVIFNESKNIRKILREGKKAKGAVYLFIILDLTLLLSPYAILNAGGSHVYFSDIEQGIKQFSAWTDFGKPTSIDKWWSASDFSLMPNNTFEVDVKRTTRNVIGTVPGTIRVNVNINNTPFVNTMVFTDTIGNSLRSCDFYNKGVTVKYNGTTTNKFVDAFDESTCILTLTLKPGQSFGPGDFYITMHLGYTPSKEKEPPLIDAEIAKFDFNYTNVASVLINGDKIYTTKVMGMRAVLIWKDPLKEDSPPRGVGGGGGLLGMLSTETPTAPVIEEPVLNETIPDNSTVDVPSNETVEVPSNETIEVPTNETVEVPTNETNTTEPGLNETAPVTYHMEAGPNAFLVPDTWATTAFQLAIDYPLILDISYTNAEGTVMTYANGDPVENSFDIVAGMTIIINASEPFDMV